MGRLVRAEYIHIVLEIFIPIANFVYFILLILNIIVILCISKQECQATMIDRSKNTLQSRVSSVWLSGFTVPLRYFSSLGTI